MSSTPTGTPQTRTAENVRPLALLGGIPAFAEPLHVGRPNIGSRQRLHERLDEIIDRRWLTNDGPLVQEFEQRLSDWIGVRHAIAMCNGTIGLEIMIRAAGLQGEVIVPSFTFVATVHALMWQEIQPVFCDIDPITHSLDPERIEELITPKTTGILAVHTWGRPAEVERLQAIADRHGLTLLFDAAHAIGCSRGGRMVGGFGAAECFSFHATKVLNCFEGGAVTTDDDRLAERIRFMRNFGFAGKDRVEYLGSNGKMNEMSAAMGLTSMDSLTEFIATNRRHWELYRDRLEALPGLSVFEHDSNEHHNYHYVVVEVDAQQAGLSRDEIVRMLEAENVLARRYFYPGSHRMQPYRSLQPQAYRVLPHTEALCQSVLTLPTGTAVTTEAIERICERIGTALQEAEAVRARLVESAADRTV